MHEFEDDIPESLRRELRREPWLGSSLRARVMHAVRRETMTPPRSGWLSPILASTLAASLLLGALGSPLVRGEWPASAQLGPARSSVLTLAIRDTLLLVRFTLLAPRAARVELVGDFNSWQPRSTPLVLDARRGAWVGQVALARGHHLYAFVVDDTQWVADPTAPPALAPNGRPASHVVIPNLD